MNVRVTKIVGAIAGTAIAGIVGLSVAGAARAGAPLLLAETDVANTIQVIGIIALPIAFMGWRWKNKRDELLIAKGRKLAQDDALKDETKKQTRTLVRFTKKLSRETLAAIRELRQDFADHKQQDEKDFGEVKTLIKNGNGNGH